MYIEIIKGSAIVVISPKTELNLVNFARHVFYHKFNLVESPCIKVISPVFLDNATLWSDTRKYRALILIMSLKIIQGEYTLF